MKKYYYLSLLFLLLLSSFNSSGQNNMFKALFIYNFTKNIVWPSSYNTQDFVIGVYGNSGIVQELNKIAKRKKANNKPIIVKKINSTSSMPKMNIIYVPINKSSHLEKIVSTLSKKPTLIITESPGLTKKGSCINFVLIKGDQKFEISKSNIHNRGLKVSNSLLSLGIAI